jgi:undecaprenyl-diphosphatase
MRTLPVLLLSALLASPLCAEQTQQDQPAQDLKTEEAQGLLSSSAAVTLGVVEGLTEFLPVSSTGHLIIASECLGLESDAPLHDKDGYVIWYKKPSPKMPEGKPLSVKIASDAYTVIIQAGAILAVVFLYWRQLLHILKGLLGRDKEGLLLLRNLLLACLPIGVLGLLLHGWIGDHLFSVQAVIVAQISGAVLMIAAERWRHQHALSRPSAKDIGDLTPLESVSIGALQCFALWPGMSRSMVTIVGGYFNGLNPPKAAEFSFLIGLPVLGGAALIKALQTGPAMVSVFGWDNILLGILVAAIAATLAVKFLVSFLSRHGLFAFALYRFILAGFLGWYFFM